MVLFRSETKILSSRLAWAQGGRFETFKVKYRMAW